MRFFLFLAIIVTAACSRQVFSSAVLSKVDATMLMVRAKPDAYKGSYVLTGGLIDRVKNSESGAELEVAELPLDARGIPKRLLIPPGKFLLVSRDRLDPMVYRSGMLISVVGEIIGSKPSAQDQKAYPLLAVRELHLWPGR